MPKKLYGIGINDVKDCEEYISVKDPAYHCWKSMFRRCFSKIDLERNPTYVGCSIHSDWIRFSVFKEWFDENYKEGYQLDKDFIKETNKLYGKEFCVFLPQELNKFIIASDKSRGAFPIGVSFSKNKRFRARCADPFVGKTIQLGTYDTPDEAHKAWKLHKNYLANKLSVKYKGLVDSRVTEKLLTMYKD